MIDLNTLQERRIGVSWGYCREENKLLPYAYFAMKLNARLTDEFGKGSDGTIASAVEDLLVKQARKEECDQAPHTSA